MNEANGNIWNEIIDDYKRARYALWCPKHTGYWERKDEAGNYYMLRAYLNACEAEPKNQLAYARILSMMAFEFHPVLGEFYKYNKFIVPAVEAYERAIEAGQKPSEKEMKAIQNQMQQYKYVLEQRDKSYIEQIKNIIGYEKLGSFSFHDSEIIWFEHKNNCARLRLKFNNIIATLLFDDIIYVETSYNPDDARIKEFYCYPNENIQEITFEFDASRIVCESIFVAMIESS